MFRRVAHRLMLMALVAVKRKSRIPENDRRWCRSFKAIFYVSRCLDTFNFCEILQSLKFKFFFCALLVGIHTPPFTFRHPIRRHFFRPSSFWLPPRKRKSARHQQLTIAKTPIRRFSKKTTLLSLTQLKVTRAVKRLQKRVASTKPGNHINAIPNAEKPF